MVKFLHISSTPDKKTFIQCRKVQKMAGFNILEVDNKNSKPLTIKIVDQVYDRPEKILGIVQAGAIARFNLDRDTLFDTFYIKITFLNRLIGTKAQLDKVADIY